MSLYEGQQLVDQGEPDVEQGGEAVGLSHPMPPPESEPPVEVVIRPAPLRVIAAGWLLAIAAAGAPLLAANDTASKLKAGTENLEQVRSRIAAANQRIDRARADQSAQRAAVEAAERRIADSQRALKKLAADLDAQETRVRSAKANRAAAESRLNAARERLARQVRSAYIAGQGGTTALVLAQREPDRVARLLSYFDYLNRASARQLDGINAEIAAVAVEQQKLDEELSSLKTVQASREKALAGLEADRQSRRKAVALLDAKIADEGERLKALKGSEQEIQALLKQLKEALAAIPPPVKKPRSDGSPAKPQKPFPQMRGHLAWPLRGSILANYGDAKQESRLQWKGLWIAANEGAPVQASADGRVAYVGWLSSYGLIVVLEHDKGFFTLYGHNATVIAAAGEEVDAGQVIAAVGNTGGYERTGLYFEVRRGTEAVDPRDWLGP